MAAKLKIDDSRFSLVESNNIYCSCIYKIIDVETGKIYIGKAKNLLKRYNYHKHKLYRGNHFNIILQRIFNKGRYLKMEVIEYTNRLEDRELFYIYKYNTLDRRFGYNMSNKSTGGTMGKPIDIYDRSYKFIETLPRIQDAVGKYATNRISVTKICRRDKYYNFTKQGYTFRYSGKSI